MGRKAKEAVRWLAALDPHGVLRPETPPSRSPKATSPNSGGSGFSPKRPSKSSRNAAASLAEYLRCRVCYFTAGVVLGGKEFVESVFQATRDRFAPGRKDGARPLRGLELAKKLDHLYNLRQLQTNLFD